MKKTDRSAVMMLAVLAAVGLLSLVGTRAAEAAFPGQNGRIAFDNNGAVWTMNPDGSDQTNLTAGRNGGGRNPSWSADGAKLAFVRSVDIPALDNQEIFTMNADGSGARRLTDNEAWDSSPAWSPDGRRIVFTRLGEEGWDIWVMNPDGSGQRRLTSMPGWQHDPAWSPDGTKIAFSHSGTFLYVMNADGTGQRRLSEIGGIGQEPAWSPDGRRIVFSKYRAGDRSMEIGMIDADGTGETFLTDSVEDNSDPAFSPTGRFVTFMSCPRDGDGESTGCRIRKMRSDGTFQVDLTSPPADTFHVAPDWQPLVPQILIPNPNALTIDWRDVLTISGRLFLGPGDPMPGQRVYLEERPSGPEDFVPVPGAEAITAEDGSFDFAKVQPLKNTEYRARFDGDEAKEIPPATGPGRQVNVRVFVSLDLSADRLRLGKALTVSGGVQPSHGGEVTLTIRRGGEKVATKRVVIDEDSRYSLNYKPRRSGNYSVSARFPGDADHLGNTSPKRSFEMIR